jgi:hypothetical protein
MRGIIAWRGLSEEQKIWKGLIKIAKRWTNKDSKIFLREIRERMGIMITIKW